MFNMHLCDRLLFILSARNCNFLLGNCPALQTQKSVILDTLHFQLPVRVDLKDSWAQFQCVCVCVCFCDCLCVSVCACSHVYVFMCAHMKFPTPKRNSWMPARCQRLQLSSDTIYLEIEQTTHQTEQTPTSDASQRSQVATCNSNQPAINRVFHDSLLGSIIC